MKCKVCLGTKQLRDIDYDGSSLSTSHTCYACKGTGVAYVDPKTVKLIDLVKDKKVRFSYYRDKEFWYEQEDGFLFPVPLADVDNPASRATLLAEDKAIYYMRWMKKYIEEAKKESERDPKACVVWAPKADDLQEGFTPQ